MTTTEDLLMAAINAAAATVEDGTAPPLRLPPERRPARARRAVRRFAPWLVPLAAAASLIAVVASLLAVSGGRRPSSPSARLPAVLAAVPRYYVSLEYIRPGCCRPGEPFAYQTIAAVRATATGAVLAVVRPPRPYATFVAVSGAAGDREFVLAAQRPARIPLQVSKFPATRFYRLMINPRARSASGRAILTALPIPVQPTGVEVDGIALSPDGSKLAMVSTRQFIPLLSVWNLATGAVRIWPGGTASQGLGPGGGYLDPLSWTGDSRTVAFVGSTSMRTPPAGLVLLDTAAKNWRLGHGARLAVRLPHGPSNPWWQDALITPDGTTVYGSVEYAWPPVWKPHSREYVKLVSFAARTGSITGVLHVRPLAGHGVFMLHWASPSGRLLIVSDSIGTVAGVYDGRHFTPIAWSRNRLTAAW